MDDDHLPNLDAEWVERLALGNLGSELTLSHQPRILLFYGANRKRSFDRPLQSFDLAGLPLPDDAPDSHAKVQELKVRCGVRRSVTTR